MLNTIHFHVKIYLPKTRMLISIVTRHLNLCIIRYIRNNGSQKSSSECAEMKHSGIFGIWWFVYLAYFRSYGLLKISKYIEMYWKLMFTTDRNPWKMHLSPSDLANRCFRVFCRWVILGVSKKSCLDVLKHALVLEFLKSNDFGQKSNKSLTPYNRQTDTILTR